MNMRIKIFFVCQIGNIKMANGHIIGSIILCFLVVVAQIKHKKKKNKITKY